MIDFQHYDTVELFQLGNTGDCLYAGMGVQYLREKYPHLEIYWTVASSYKHIPSLFLPHDNIRVLNYDQHNQKLDQLWYATESLIIGNICVTDGKRVITLCPQIWPNNFKNFDSTIRTSVLRGFGVGDDFSTIRLNLESAAAKNSKVFDLILRNITDNTRNKKFVLVESAFTSGQSIINQDYLSSFISEIPRRFLRDIYFIDLSGGFKLNDSDEYLLDGSELSIEQIIHLLPKIDCFIGCGSGLSVLATFYESYRGPIIQVIRGDQGYFASMYQEAVHARIRYNNIIELASVSPETLASKFLQVLFGVGEVQPLVAILDFRYYLEIMDRWAFKRGRYLDVVMSLENVFARFGPQCELTRYLRDVVYKHIQEDPFFQLLSVRGRLANVIEAIKF